MDRKSELDAFKTLNLSVIASAYGFEIDRKKSTRHSVLMSNGSDKIIVSKSGQHYVYCSVHDPGSSGTAIDFAQKVIQPGASLGEIRSLLRPYLNSSYMSNVKRKYTGRYVSEIKPSEVDLAAVQARYSRFVPIAEPHGYLCDVRGVPFELLQSWRLRGRVRTCPRYGSAIFPHWGFPEKEESAERCLVGFEIKGNVSMFAKGGRKGLWISAGKKSDQRLAFAESGLDAISYLAVRGGDHTRVVSIAGKVNPYQPALIRSAIERMEEGAEICAAYDNDQAGDQLTAELADIVAGVGRSDLQLIEDRAPSRGADWNQVLMDEGLKTGRIQAAIHSFGR